MVFNPGKVQRTTNISKSIIASCELEEDIPAKFGIFDMNQFLSALTLLDEPELEFGDKGVKIKSDSNEIFYRYSEPSLIQSITEETFGKIQNLAHAETSFTLTKEMLKKIQEASSILKAEHLLFEGKNGRVALKTYNPKDEGESKASFDIGSTEERFKIVMNFMNLKILPGDYVVSVSRSKILGFEGTSAPVSYYIPGEKDSTFG